MEAETMLKKLGIPTLALATAMAVAAPTVTLARDRDDDRRGGNSDRHEAFRGRDDRGGRSQDRDDRDWGFRGGNRFNFGVGFYSAPAPVYSAPAPAASGYYDRYGVWHPDGYYDQYNRQSYGY
jgi:hypothetical protein